MQITPDQAALKNAAEAGDSMAQYQYAARLSGEGLHQEAVAWLEKATEGGNGDACYTLANLYLSGHLTEKNESKARALLAQQASLGHDPCSALWTILLAMGIGGAVDWPQAVKALFMSAQTGSPRALYELALLRQLYGIDDDLNGQLLIAAATRGHLIAAVAAAQRFVDGEALLDAATAKQYAQEGIAARHPLAASMAATIQGTPSTQPLIPSAVPQMAEAVLAPLLTAPETLALPKRELLSESPEAYVCRSLVPSAIADHVIVQSAPRLRPAQIVDPVSGESKQDPYRNSFNVTFWPADLDLVLFAVGARMCAVAGVAAAQGEMLSTLFYQPGMYYRPHFDYLTSDQGTELERSGQRIKTVLLYLNKGYEGGATRFIETDIAFTGEVGDALIFHNVDPAGEPDRMSLHESTKLVSGVKWLASKWIRGRAYKY